MRHYDLTEVGHDLVIIFLSLRDLTGVSVLIPPEINVSSSYHYMFTYSVIIYSFFQIVLEGTPWLMGLKL